MASTSELAAKKQRLSDLRFLLVSLESRQASRQQELATNQQLIAQIRDTIPRIERALAQALASGDTARAQQAQADLTASQQDLERFLAENARLQSAIINGQEAINGAQQDILNLEIEIRALESQGSGADSAGVDATSAAAARDNLGSAQNPPVGPQELTATGVVQGRSNTAVPSNAASSDPNAVGQNNQTNANFGTAPPKIQTGSAAGAGVNVSNGAGTGGQSPLPPRQSSATNLDNLTYQPDTSYVYMAYEVTSIFSKGSFTQEISGAQIFFDLPTASQDAEASQRVPNPASTPKELDVLRSVGRPGPTVAAAAGRDPKNPLNLNPAGAATTIDLLQPSGPALAAAKNLLPTSGTQSVATSGGASGTASGATNVVQVSTVVTLNSGQTQRVNSQAQINDLYQQGLISVNEAGAALFRLQTQIAAQSAQTSTTSQLIAKD